MSFNQNLYLDCLPFQNLSPAGDSFFNCHRRGITLELQDYAYEAS